MNCSIYACDVGSTLQGRFAWARIRKEKPANIEVCQESGCGAIRTLAAEVRADMSAAVTDGRRIAIGFEAPLFIPELENPSLLCRGRYGDNNRSCFAPPAAAVAMLGLHQAAWLFESLNDVPVRLVWSYEQWVAEPSLLIWEAFVSGGAKPAHRRTQHKKIVPECLECSMVDAHDAATAADAFLSFMNANGRIAARISAERPLSLIGVAVLWSGWSSRTDVLPENILRQQVIVLRPEVSVVDHSPERIETFAAISRGK